MDSTTGNNDLIKVGDYIVIQKQKYFKLHQLNSKCDITLGKDKVDLKAIVGQPLWTTFKMLPRNKREFGLEIATQVESLPEAVMKEVSSGNDNRNITDDGKSQLLSTEDIVAFRDSGLSAQNIVGKLIESSTTFKNKTEYSQEKYLKKKEKKYFEYIVVRKPTVRLLAQIFYDKDQFSVLGLRHDSIAQILSYANIQSNGTYALFESGTQALLGAAILDSLTGGNLVNISSGRTPPKQAILGMNFSEEKLKRFLSVRLCDFVSKLEGKEVVWGNEAKSRVNGHPKNASAVPSEKQEVSSSDGSQKIDSSLRVVEAKEPSVGEGSPGNEASVSSSDKASDSQDVTGSKKRKLVDDENQTGRPDKRPRWLETLDMAVDLLKPCGADGLIIACKEFPLNIIQKLLPYVKPSRQLVVYSLYREPLVQLYTELKKTRKDVIGLHIYENWLRSHQILTDRTHPDVTMSASGGHILVGTKVTP
uniref:tRNA (adenine(58)-N(1))-methyltransferase non-catalytic subunit TRM6 n=2 Tax=Lygus hesperus TaxID=30085 RepID=A0A0A9Z027_LYGHE